MPCPDRNPCGDPDEPLPPAFNVTLDGKDLGTNGRAISAACLACNL
jgi:hypothetical protein